MVGLMQIMIYLLSIYLVYKGVEIFQVAFVASEYSRNRKAGVVIGILAIVVAIFIGLAAVFMADSMAEKIGTNMESVGK